MGEASSSARRRVSQIERHFGRYLLRKKLGQGGMAEVFLADKAGPGGAKIECAVKRILPHHADTPARVTFFLQEMKLAAKLQHRNVVRVHDFGDVDGVYFLELELVRGMDLKSLCQRLRERAEKHPPRYPGQERGLLPPVAVASIGMQTCEGLAYAHTCRDHDSDVSGVLHRDISNDNLMATLEGEVKINDWGISKGLKGDKNILSKTNHAYGKLLFAPPEQLGGREIDARADLYALGISLFKLLAGRHPYDNPAHPNENPVAKISRAARKDGRPPMSALLPGVPVGLQEILERLIQPERDDRPASAEELVGAFKAVIKGLGHDVDDARRELGQLVNLVYDHGPPTITEMQGYREPSDGSVPEVSADSPERSAARPISPRTEPLEGDMVVPATTPLQGMARGGATAPLPEGEYAGSESAPPDRASSPSRGMLLATLGVLSLLMIALATFVAVFFWPSEPDTGSVTAPQAPVPDEPTGALPPPPSIPAEQPPPAVAEPPLEESLPAPVPNTDEPPQAESPEPTEAVAETPENEPSEEDSRPRERTRVRPRRGTVRAPIPPAIAPDPRTRTRSREAEPGQGAFGL